MRAAPVAGSPPDDDDLDCVAQFDHHWVGGGLARLRLGAHDGRLSRWHVALGSRSGAGKSALPNHEVDPTVHSW